MDSKSKKVRDSKSGKSSKSKQRQETAVDFDLSTQNSERDTFPQKSNAFKANFNINGVVDQNLKGTLNKNTEFKSWSKTKFTFSESSNIGERFLTTIQVFRNLKLTSGDKRITPGVPQSYCTQTVTTEINISAKRTLDEISSCEGDKDSTLVFGAVNCAEQAALKKLTCVIVPINVKPLYNDLLIDSFQELLNTCQGYGTEVIFALSTRYLTDKYQNYTIGSYPIYCVGIPTELQDLSELQVLRSISKKLKNLWLEKFCSLDHSMPHYFDSNSLWVAAYYGLACPEFIRTYLTAHPSAIEKCDSTLNLTPLGVAYHRQQLGFLKIFSETLDFPLSRPTYNEPGHIGQVISSFLASHAEIIPAKHNPISKRSEKDFINDDYSNLSLYTTTLKLSPKDLGEAFFSIYFTDGRMFDTLISRLLPSKHRRVAWVITRWALLSDVSIFNQALSFYGVLWSNLLYSHLNKLSKPGAAKNFKPLFSNGKLESGMGSDNKEENISSWGETLLTLACSLGLEDHALAIIFNIFRSYATKAGITFRLTKPALLNDINTKERIPNQLYSVLPLRFFKKQDSLGLTAANYADHLNLTKVSNWLNIILTQNSSVKNTHPLPLSAFASKTDNPPLFNFVFNVDKTSKNKV